MTTLAVSDDLKQLLDENLPRIKEDYFTLKMFVDSAVRDKLRSMGVKGVGDDEVIAHISRLQISKARHVDQRKLLRQKRNMKVRIARRLEQLDEI